MGLSLNYCWVYHFFIWRWEKRFIRWISHAR